ncbi:MAG: hypothetical protein SNH27_05085 [Rikenellaceae bacterium]
MKHKGSSTFEYSKDRIDDLMRAYDKYISTCGHICMRDVYSSIVEMPSKRFWVSDTRASLVVSSMLKIGDNALDGMWPTNKEMYKEIFKRVIKLREENPNYSILELCTIVVEQPAPKFYLTPGTAKIIVCKSRSQWKREKLKRLRVFL